MLCELQDKGLLTQIVGLRLKTRESFEVHSRPAWVLGFRFWAGGFLGIGICGDDVVASIVAGTQYMTPELRPFGGVGGSQEASIETQQCV